MLPLTFYPQIIFFGLVISLNMNNKIQLQVLLKTRTRINLSLAFETRYKDKYPSFSVFVEEVLIKGLDILEVE